MKKYSYIIPLTFLIIISGMIFLRKGTDRQGSRDTAFAIKDTANVQLIYIRHDDDNELVLKRVNGRWTLNDSLTASPVAVDNFMFVMRRLRIRGIKDTEIIDDEENTGYRIKIMEGRNKLIFRYYPVKGMNLIHREGSRRIYYSEIFGFPDLSLGDVVTADPYYWRTRILCSYKPDEIIRIELHYPENPVKGFALLKDGEEIKLFNPSDNTFYPSDSVIRDNAQMFTSYFMNIYFEDFLRDRVKTDSILDLTPEMRIVIEDIRENVFQIEIWPDTSKRKAEENLIYIRINNDNEILLARPLITYLWQKERKDFLF